LVQIKVAVDPDTNGVFMVGARGADCALRVVASAVPEYAELPTSL
jgi:hypothetical protein